METYFVEGKGWHICAFDMKECAFLYGEVPFEKIVYKLGQVASSYSCQEP